MQSIDSNLKLSIIGMHTGPGRGKSLAASGPYVTIQLLGWRRGGYVTVIGEEFRSACLPLEWRSRVTALPSYALELRTIVVWGREVAAAVVQFGATHSPQDPCRRDLVGSDLKTSRRR
jgi:hypothetical protein